MNPTAILIVTVASIRFSRALRGIALALAATAIAGCQTIETYMPVVQQLGVYKIDINQGNYLSQDMVDRLQVGMSRQQVRATLGTPLVTSAFRDSRWDYVYEFTRQGKVREHRQFTVYFADEKLARWEGDEMPQSVVELNRAAGEKALKKQPDADDQGFFGKILEWFKKN
ncbi:MAG TPA: outer membrane protein assembly factor BamE [Casimicrobiaceae bacterium]|nr:outer membrane protein assembly factor BamE [Casimicrobiaceae bacterium]